ncbi:hypothetical protein AB0N09_37955 [Streptomyces erythrochromogenes]|uniref:hypothetical protein n=1 Tax=Streptomyces erythrochromogenes TaxID=285574 RepID=UPI003439D7F9
MHSSREVPYEKARQARQARRRRRKQRLPTRESACLEGVVPSSKRPGQEAEAGFAKAGPRKAAADAGSPARPCAALTGRITWRGRPVPHGAGFLRCRAEAHG